MDQFATVRYPRHELLRVLQLPLTGEQIYVARPPVSSERLSVLDDGRLLYKLKNRWRDGTTHLLLEPSELLERLSVLIPAPRAKHRVAIVPLPTTEPGRIVRKLSRA